MTEETASTGGSAGQQTTYQMVTLTAGLARETLKDDSPQVLQDELWQFLNIDLSTANLTPIDALNILDMVDIAFSNFLIGLPEDRWETFQIKEIIWDKDPDNPDPNAPLKAIATRIYNLTELWDAARAKVYIKCRKSIDGFMIRSLTEQRSSLIQSYEERGVARPGEPIPLNGQTGKRSWRFW